MLIFPIRLSYTEAHLVDGLLHQMIENMTDNKERRCVACGADIVLQEPHAPSCPCTTAASVLAELAKAPDMAPVAVY